MDFYPKAAMALAMRVQDVILQALARKITWWQAAEILGISDIEWIFSLQFERAVNRNNRVSFENLSLQIERVSWRATLAGCQVMAISTWIEP
jgi:hypothetical protein